MGDTTLEIKISWNNYVPFWLVVGWPSCVDIPVWFLLLGINHYQSVISRLMLVSSCLADGYQLLITRLLTITYHRFHSFGFHVSSSWHRIIRGASGTAPGPFWGSNSIHPGPTAAGGWDWRRTEEGCESIKLVGGKMFVTSLTEVTYQLLGVITQLIT